VHRRQGAPACLTADQVTTIQKYYAGTIDPVNGQLINPGSERGNETDDVRALGLAFQEQLPEPAFDGLFYWCSARASAIRRARSISRISISTTTSTRSMIGLPRC